MIFLRVLGFFVYFFTIFSSSFSVIILVSKLNQLVIFLLLFSILLFRGTLSYKLTKNRKLFAARSVFRILFPILQFRFQSHLFPCVCVCVFLCISCFPFFQSFIGIEKKVARFVLGEGVECLCWFCFSGKDLFYKNICIFHTFSSSSSLWFTMIRRFLEEKI